jgi:hypothetical protein
MISIDLVLLEASFGVNEEARDVAREAIIEESSIPILYQCVEEARRRNDAEALEFWLVELITCRGDAATIGKAILELSLEILEPQSRFHEGLIYLRYIQRSVYEDLHKEISNTLSRFENVAKLQTHVRATEGWKSYDITKGIERGKDQQHYYDRFVSYFMATKEEKMDPLIADLKVDFLPRIIGYFQGITGAISDYGVESETVIFAFDEFLKIAYPDFIPGAVKMSTGAFGVTPNAEVMIQPKAAGEETPKMAVTQQAKPAKKGYGLSKS